MMERARRRGTARRLWEPRRIGTEERAPCTPAVEASNPEDQEHRGKAADRAPRHRCRPEARRRAMEQTTAWARPEPAPSRDRETAAKTVQEKATEPLVAGAPEVLVAEPRGPPA